MKGTHISILSAMRIITGDETGLIKQILIENKRIVATEANQLTSSSVGERRVGRILWSVWRGPVKREVKKTSWVLLWGSSTRFHS